MWFNYVAGCLCSECSFNGCGWTNRLAEVINLNEWFSFSSQNTPTAADLGAVRVCFVYVWVCVCVWGGIRTAQNLLYTIHQMSVCLSLHGKSYTVWSFSLMSSCSSSLSRSKPWVSYCKLIFVWGWKSSFTKKVDFKEKKGGGIKDRDSHLLMMERQGRDSWKSFAQCCYGSVQMFFALAFI